MKAKGAQGPGESPCNSDAGPLPPDEPCLLSNETQGWMEPVQARPGIARRWMPWSRRTATSAGSETINT